MTTAVIVEATDSAEGEDVTVTVVGIVVAHTVAVTAMEGDLAVEETVAAEGRTVVVTEIAEVRLAVTTDRAGLMAVVGMTEGRMAEVAAMVTVAVAEIVVENRMAVVVMVEAEVVAVWVVHLVAVKMKCSLSRTRYLFKVSPIRSQNKSSFSILAPLA